MELIARAVFPIRTVVKQTTHTDTDHRYIIEIGGIERKYGKRLTIKFKKKNNYALSPQIELK